MPSVDSSNSVDESIFLNVVTDPMILLCRKEGKKGIVNIKRISFLALEINTIEMCFLLVLQFERNSFSSSMI